MSIFQWPFKRKEYPGVGNPRFVSDIVAANEATIDAMKALTGLGSVDFAIITGLDFTPGAPNGVYSPGVFYLNGSFYYMGAGFSEGLYLTTNPTDIEPQPFEDGISRLTYTVLSGISTSNPAGATPIFSGDMNAYRIGLKSVKNSLVPIQTTVAQLGNSAFRNVGNTGGTVAAGDDPRFGYTQGQIDTLFAKKVDVIIKGAGTAYTPTASTDPVNKQYADSAAGVKLLWLGQVNGDGSSFKIAGSLSVTSARQGTGNYRLSHNFGSNNFFCTGMGVDDVAVLSSPRSFIQIAGGTQFDVHVSDDASANDAAVQIAMWSYF
jgi:hypothetical protein